MSISKQRSNTSQCSLRKGFQVNSNVEVDSPKQNNQQHVNVTVRNVLPRDTPLHEPHSQPLRSRDVELTEADPSEYLDEEALAVGGFGNTQPLTKDKPVMTNPSVFAPPLADSEAVNETPIQKHAESNTKYIQPIRTNVKIDELLDLCKSKDELINALSLVVDIYQHNPLIISKYIIPDEKMLTDLLYCLTSADEVTIQKQSIVDGGCWCKGSGEHNYAVITKIMIKKDNQSFNFKYSYPNVIEFLEERAISWKYCC